MTRALGALAALALAAGGLLGGGGTSRANSLAATPETFAAVFAASGGGDNIELASGDYGRFTGGVKPSTVTIRPQAGAAVTMTVAFDGAANIRIEGVTLPGADLAGSTHDIAIAGSRFTGQAVVDAKSMVDANIVFDGDTFDAISVCGDCYEGRLEVVQYPRGTQPVGVTVTNSHFGGGGESDGVQVAAYGVTVGPGNTFEDLQQGSYARHVDSIQLYGQSHTSIVGNFFRHNSVEIMAPDGGDHEVITDNVFLHAGGAAIQLGGHSGSVFAHNTVRDVLVAVDTSRDAVLRDNIMIGSEFSSGCSNCTTSFNLFSARDDASGSSVIVAQPVFVGGAAPPAYAGFELAPGSPGKGSASDGTDRGARPAVVGARSGSTPGSPAATAPGSPAAAAHRGPRVTLRVARRATWRQMRRGLGVRVTTRTKVRVTLLLSRSTGRVRSLARVSRRQSAGTRRYRLRPTRARLGRRRAQTLTLRATVTTAGGARTKLSRTIRVSR